MGQLFTTRRSEWLPGVAVLGATAGITTLLGVSLGVRSWAAYVGVFVAMLLAYGWAEARRARRQAKPPEPRARGKLKLIHGGKGSYDLESDETTSEQKYLM